MSDSSSPLLERLARLRERVADLVEHRSATDPTADDPMRGMYLTDDAVRHLLFGGAQDTAPAPGPDTAPSPGPDPADAPDPAKEPAGAEEPDPAEEPADDDRLHWLAHWLRLSPLDTQILLIALAPDLDRTFESLYAYLNDDVTRRRATVALALDLCGVPTHSAAGRSRFHPAARLIARGLLEVEEPERPFLSRSLRVPDRVLAHLLGDDTPDPALGGTVRLLPYLPAEQNADDAQDTTGPLARRLAGELSAHPLTVYLREHRDGDGLAFATAALGAAGLPALHLVPAERRGEHRPEEHAPVERAAGSTRPTGSCSARPG